MDAALALPAQSRKRRPAPARSPPAHRRNLPPPKAHRRRRPRLPARPRNRWRQSRSALRIGGRPPAPAAGNEEAAEPSSARRRPAAFPSAGHFYLGVAVGAAGTSRSLGARLRNLAQHVARPNRRPPLARRVVHAPERRFGKRLRDIGRFSCDETARGRRRLKHKARQSLLSGFRPCGFPRPYLRALYRDSGGDFYFRSVFPTSGKLLRK